MINSQSVGEAAQIDIAAVSIPGFQMDDNLVITYQVTLKVGFRLDACAAVEVNEGFFARFTIDSRPEIEGSEALFFNGQAVCSVPVDKYGRITYQLTVLPLGTMRNPRTGAEFNLPPSTKFATTTTTFDSATGRTVASSGIGLVTNFDLHDPDSDSD
jgi:hypothetical protein